MCTDRGKLRDDMSELGLSPIRCDSSTQTPLRPKVKKKVRFESSINRHHSDADHSDVEQSESEGTDRIYQRLEVKPATIKTIVLQAAGRDMKMRVHR